MLGLDVANAAFLPSAFAALVAGFLSFISPCVLPLVPPYLAYMTGIGVGDLKQGRGRAVPAAMMFVLGLSTVFLILGLSVSAMGRAVLQWQDWISRISGAMVVVMGLHFLHVIRIPILDREVRMDTEAQGGTFLGAYVLGLAFAFGWTPCIGPQLSVILALAATNGQVGQGTALLAIYAFGLGIPFILSAVFVTRAMSVMDRIKPWLGTVERVMGVFLIVVGIMLVTGSFSALSYWLLETFPALALVG